MSSAACVTARPNRIHLLPLGQQCRSSKSKVKFGQAINRCKRVLKASKLSYTNKTKSLSLPRNLTLGTFGKLLIVFSIKVDLLYLLYLTVQTCRVLHLIMQNCLV